MARIFSLIFLCSCIASAELNIVVPADSSFGNETIAKLNTQCPRMPYQYLDVIHELHELESQLQAVVKQEPNDWQKMGTLLQEIRIRTSRLLQMATAEWHTEKWDVAVKWNISREIFFGTDEKEYLDLQKKFRETFGGRTNEDFLYLLNFRRPQITAVKLLSAHFIGQENQDVKSYFNLNLFLNSERGLEFSYSKKATALEWCQLFNTIDFEIEVSYEESVLDTYILPHKKVFHLIKIGRN